MQMGLAQCLRASKQIHLAACVDNLDLLHTIIGGLPWNVLVILPYAGDVVPKIILQAGNVVCLSPLGALRGVPAEALSAQMVEDAVMLAYSLDPSHAHVQHSEVISAANNFRVTPSRRAIAPAIELSQHQKDVMTLMVKGLTNREIARVLGVSLPTARYHVSAILTKLGVSNRTEASGVAVNLNLIENRDL
jgi:DNA-binding CsgD family transcriptional regulator